MRHFSNTRLAVLALLSIVTPPALADTAPDLTAETRALLDQWLKAQNNGSFATYKSLYASRFTGVRRSGPRTVRLDRDGWMKDRGRMFKKKMAVAAKEIKIASVPGAARVLLVQRFEQGSYQDVGQKQLVIIREAGAARIAREEMLSSELTGRTGGGKAPDPNQLALMIPEGIVLSSVPDETWGTGPRRLALGDPVVVAQAVDPKRLPPELVAWSGRAVRLYTTQGKTCDTTVTSLKLVARVVPHFGTRQTWEQQKRDVVANEAWQLAEGGRLLVGELAKRCDGAHFARAASLAAPALAVPAEAAPALRIRALAALRALPEWQRLQTSYAGESGGGGRWDEHAGASPTVTAFRIETPGQGTRAFVSAAASIAGGCGEFGGDLWALWELMGDKLVLRNDPGRFAVTPILAVDADGDGDPELIYERSWELDNQGGVVHASGGLWTEIDRLTVPFLDCPC